MTPPSKTPSGPLTPAKPRRKPRRKPKQPVTLLDRARQTAGRAVDSLDDCVERVTVMLGHEKYDQRLASHLAYLAKHAIIVLGELRKLEAHDQRAVKAMTVEEKDAQVLAYVRDMPRDRRAQIRAAIDELDAEQLLA